MSVISHSPYILRLMGASTTILFHNVRPAINANGEIYAFERDEELRIQNENEKKITKCKKIINKLFNKNNSPNKNYLLYKSWGKELIQIYLQIESNKFTMFTYGLCFFGANEIYLPVNDMTNINTLLQILDDLLYFITTGSIITSLPSSNLFYMKKNKLLYRKDIMERHQCSDLHTQIKEYCNYIQLGELITNINFTEINLVEDYSSGS